MLSYVILYILSYSIMFHNASTYYNLLFWYFDLLQIPIQRPASKKKVLESLGVTQFAFCLGEWNQDGVLHVGTVLWDVNQSKFNSFQIILKRIKIGHDLTKKANVWQIWHSHFLNCQLRFNTCSKHFTNCWPTLGTFHQTLAVKHFGQLSFKRLSTSAKVGAVQKCVNLADFETCCTISEYIDLKNRLRYRQELARRSLLQRPYSLRS